MPVQLSMTVSAAKNLTQPAVCKQLICHHHWAVLTFNHIVQKFVDDKML
jgi:hypothetical protein